MQASADVPDCRSAKSLRSDQLSCFCFFSSIPLILNAFADLKPLEAGTDEFTIQFLVISRTAMTEEDRIADGPLGRGMINITEEEEAAVDTDRMENGIMGKYETTQGASPNNQSKDQAALGSLTVFEKELAVPIFKPAASTTGSVGGEATSRSGMQYANSPSTTPAVPATVARLDDGESSQAHARNASVVQQSRRHGATFDDDAVVYSLIGSESAETVSMSVEGNPPRALIVEGKAVAEPDLLTSGFAYRGCGDEAFGSTDAIIEDALGFLASLPAEDPPSTIDTHPVSIDEATEPVATPGMMDASASVTSTEGQASAADIQPVSVDEAAEPVTTPDIMDASVSNMSVPRAGRKRAGIRRSQRVISRRGVN